MGTVLLVLLAPLSGGELNSRSAQARIHLARTLIERGRIVEALRQLDLLLRSNPDQPDVQFEIGRMLQELAASRFSRLQQLAPDSAEVHQLLGKSYEAQGKLEEALVEYQAALKRNPNGPGLHFLIGNIHWRLRNFDVARQELEQELRMNPQHSLANLRLGQIYLAENEPEKAARLLERAVGGDPALVQAHRQLGKAYRATGNYAGALREFQFVASRQPNDDSVHAQLAGVYKSLGETERARKELEIHRGILNRKLEAARQTRRQTGSSGPP